VKRLNRRSKPPTLEELIQQHVENQLKIHVSKLLRKSTKAARREDAKLLEMLPAPESDEDDTIDAEEVKENDTPEGTISFKRR